MVQEADNRPGFARYFVESSNSNREQSHITLIGLTKQAILLEREGSQQHFPDPLRIHRRQRSDWSLRLVHLQHVNYFNKIRVLPAG